MLHRTHKSVSLAGPEKALDWLGIMRSQGEVHTFKEASDQECRDRTVSGRDVDFLWCIPAQVTKDNTCRARHSAASGAANFCAAFCILSWAALSPAKDTFKHRIYNFEYRPPIEGKEYKHKVHTNIQKQLKVCDLFWVRLNKERSQP